MARIIIESPSGGGELEVEQSAFDCGFFRGYVYVGDAGPVASTEPAVFDTRVRDLVNDWASAPTALTAIGAAPIAVPSHAGTRSRFNDPTRSIYNLKAANTRRLRASLAAARAGTGLCRLAFAGDSLVAGYQDTRGTSDPVTYLRTRLTQQGYTVSELLQAWSNTTEPRLTLTGGPWGSDASVTFPWLGNDSTSGTVSYTGTGTVLEIVTSTSSPAFTYAIDSGTAVTVTPPGGAQGVYLVTVTGLSNASHTVKLTMTNHWVYLHAVGFRQTTGVVVQNAGITSASTQDWLNTSSGGYGPAQSLFSTAYAAHDAVFIELGVNNLLHTVGTASSFATDLGALVDQARAQTSSNPATVVLVTSNYPQGDDTTWPPYVSAIYDVADSKDCPLIDFADRLGLYSAYSTSQGAGDGIHLNPAGQAHKALAWSNALTA